MSLYRNFLLLSVSSKSSATNRYISATAPCLSNIKFRKQKGLSLNPNFSGVLTDSPDYTYLDGRLTPLGRGQRRRFLRQKEARDQIISLSKEIDFAIDRHKQALIDEENKKQKILDSKLKPKGLELLKSK